ncbi:2-methylisoborneol synthase [Streptomyces chrestomyceticus JCM 4735]|uniref:Terpene synthase n=1 Tax=Streptomyces chrestomyceticus JCM 4735 TaxID=1306181 RepID=A0A7U9PY73_9ACTN|nr:family 2 encapsulin nanocompartment cargo protein terpene cyclase [Streptomyces chrestomyceticus]GCD32934.1 2-methylisoborneol synthase [Streptomyces chrestomyceticus JCM 4735]
MSSLSRVFAAPTVQVSAPSVPLPQPACPGERVPVAPPPESTASWSAPPAERTGPWLPDGPTGLGTSAARALLPLPEEPAPPAPGPEAGPAPEGGPRPGDPIPGLYCPPAVPADPAKVAEVDRRLEAWAHDLDLFPPEWAGDFAGFQVGRAVVLQHPAAASLERLVVAGKLLVAENVVDDCYCEDYGGSPIGLGGRLIIAQSALDPLHTADGYQQQWHEGLGADAPLRSYADAMRAFREIASPSQVTRFVHDMARLHLGYLAEGAWAQTRTTPPVWKYLVMRQFNNFRPCLSLVDAVDGYELSEPFYSRPEVQRVTALACNATTLVNDLYSFTKEMAVDEHHLNLPVVIAAEDRGGLKEAYLKAVGIHNEIMHAFEDESAVLAARNPVLARYTTGLAAWVAGNHEWHHTNTYRYSLPNYW